MMDIKSGVVLVVFSLFVSTSAKNGLCQNWGERSIDFFKKNLEAKKKEPLPRYENIIANRNDIRYKFRATHAGIKRDDAEEQMRMFWARYGNADEEDLALFIVSYPFSILQNRTGCFGKLDPKRHPPKDTEMVNDANKFGIDYTNLHLAICQMQCQSFLQDKGKLRKFYLFNLWLDEATSFDTFWFELADKRIFDGLDAKKLDTQFWWILRWYLTVAYATSQDEAIDRLRMSYKKNEMAEFRKDVAKEIQRIHFWLKTNLDSLIPVEKEARWKYHKNGELLNRLFTFKIRRIKSPFDGDDRDYVKLLKTYLFERFEWLEYVEHINKK